MTTERDEYVTLITQMSPNRIHVLQMMIDAWEGPISAVIAVNHTRDNPPKPTSSRTIEESQEFDLSQFLSASVPIHRRHHIKIGIYNTTGISRLEYPINKLRNMAWDQANRTPLAFLIDGDFVPSKDAYRNLIHHPLIESYIEDPQKLPSGSKTAFVVSAFDSKKIIHVDDKEDGIRLFRNGTLAPFGFQHHKASNLTKWLSYDRPYCVETTEKER